MAVVLVMTSNALPLLILALGLGVASPALAKPAATDLNLQITTTVGHVSELLASADKACDCEESEALMALLMDDFGADLLHAYQDQLAHEAYLKTEGREGHKAEYTRQHDWNGVINDPKIDWIGAMGTSLAAYIAALEGSDDQQCLRLQEQMQRENQMFSSISNVLKTRHEAAKNSIGNIR